MNQKDKYLMLKKHLERTLGIDFKPTKKYVEQYVKSLPSMLYRFREVNEYNIESLEEEYLWCSKPNKFKDTFDSNIKVEFLKYKDSILDIVSDNFIHLLVIELGKALEKKGISYNVEKLYDLINFIEQKYSYHDRRDEHKIRLAVFQTYRSFNRIDLLPNLLRKIRFNMNKKEFEDKIMSQSQIARESFMVSCLTEDYQHKLMWENYTDNGNGFVIGYSFDKLIKQAFSDRVILLDVAPVIYNAKDNLELDKLFEIGIEQHIDRHLNGKDDAKYINKLKEFDVIMHLHARTKFYEYIYEKEWRLMTPLKEDRRVNFPFTKSLIIGEKVKKEDKDRLISIGKKLGVDLYLRRVNQSRTDYIFDKI